MRKLIILLVLLFAVRVSAAAHYVNAAATDGGDGTTAGLTGVNAAFDTLTEALPGGTGGVAEGDTVNVAAGTYENSIRYDEAADDTGRTSWITYIGDANDRPIIRDMQITDTTNAYVRFYNFAFYPKVVANNHALIIKGAGMADKRISYVEFYNCLFSNTDTTNSKHCVSAGYLDYIRFDDCEFSAGRTSISLEDHFTNVNIIDCNMHDQWNDGITIYPQEVGETCSGVLLDGCVFTNQTPREGITTVTQHYDIIQVSGIAALDNLTIRSCTLVGSWAAEMEDWAGYSLNYSLCMINHIGDGIVFENNLLYGTSQGQGWRIEDVHDDVVVRNNTFAYTSARPGLVGFIDEDCTAVKHHNNIWRKAFRMMASDVVQNNNIYSDYSALSAPAMGGNSDEIGATAAAALFEDFDNDDFTLAGGSSAIDFGDSSNATTTDILGQARDTSPDAGAYEYDMAGPTTEDERKERSLKMKKEEIMQAVARGWCSEANSGKVMDTNLAMAITEEILKMPCEANLGCATTREILNEVKARIEVNGNLDYKTACNAD